MSKNNCLYVETNKDIDLSKYVYENYNKDYNQNKNILRKNIHEFLNNLTLSNEYKNKFLSNFENVTHFSLKNEKWDDDFEVRLNKKTYFVELYNKTKKIIDSKHGSKYHERWRTGEENIRINKANANNRLNYYREEAEKYKYYKIKNTNKNDLTTFDLDNLKKGLNDFLKNSKIDINHDDDVDNFYKYIENINNKDDLNNITIFYDKRMKCYLEINIDNIKNIITINKDYFKMNIINPVKYYIFMVLAIFFGILIIILFILFLYYSNKIFGFSILAPLVPMIMFSVSAANIYKDSNSIKDLKNKKLDKYYNIHSKIINEFNKVISAKIFNEKINEIKLLIENSENLERENPVE